MVRVNNAPDRKLAKATTEKGLVIVHTGAGKGKSTASFGMAIRALGQGMKVGIVQFIKGAIPTGEAAFFAKLDLPVEMQSRKWAARLREKLTPIIASPPCAGAGVQWLP